MSDIDIIIKKLSLLDKDAAEYVQQMYDNGNIEHIIDAPEAITYLFTWSDQPQGHAYWSQLYYKYMELPSILLTAKGNSVCL